MAQTIIDKLGKTQKATMELVYREVKAAYSNKIVQAGILAIVAKETAFIVQRELSYKNTNNIQYIRDIFGERLRGFTDKQITDLKADEEQWFDYLYGGVLGNSKKNKNFRAISKTLPKSDGYKYRGVSFNGLTYKAIYEKYSKLIGVDIVNKPELMLNPDVAAKALLAYYRSEVTPNQLKKWDISGDLNNATTLTSVVGVLFNVTAGVGLSREQAIALGIRTKTWDKVNDYAVEFYNWILQKEGASPQASAFDSTQSTQTTPTPTQPQVNPQTGTVDQENSRGDVTGQNQTSSEKKSPSANFISQITEPRLKPRVISFEVPKDERRKKQIAENFGIIPFVFYGSYQIDQTDISFLQIYTVGNLPTVKIVFNDTLGLMKDKGFPLDDMHISIFINPRSEQLKPIHMDFKIAKFTVSGGTYTITGVIDANQLYIKKFKSFSKKTSFQALKLIAEEIGLGFASNIDDTSDEMTWINPGQKYVEFIDHIVDNSYKSDETYLSSYIDFYYNFTYVDVEKELRRNIKEELGIGNIGLKEIAKQDKEVVQKILLTNDAAFANSNSYFMEYRILNNSTSISLREGYSTKVKFYDEIKKDFLVFNLFGITADEQDKIIMKGKPQDEEFFNENTDLVYLGKLDGDNMYPNYHYSNIQNYRNLTELEKVGLEVKMKSPNYNLYKYKKVYLVISNQRGTPAASMNNNRLSGEWLIVDIIYRFEGGKYEQIIKLVKRELEISEEERSSEEVQQSAKKDTTRGSFENPSDSTQETTQPQSATASEVAESVGSVPPDVAETEDMAFDVPPPPQSPTKSSPSGFPIKSTSFKKIERNPTQIILHYTAGWQVLDKGAGTIDFLMNGRADYPGGLSYHYIISVDGHIENLVDPKYVASHSGDPINGVSIGISLASLGTTFDYLGIAGANKQLDNFRKSSNPNRKLLYGKNQDYVNLVDFNGRSLKYRNFTSCQEVSPAQIAALRGLLKNLKARFPSLPSYSGLTQDHFNILFPTGISGDLRTPSWKKNVPGIYTHCSITSRKVDIAPTPNLVNFFKTLRL